MYSDDEEKKGFPIRDFLLKLVLVIIFVLLLMWLLPTGNKDVDLSPLTDRIFNANLQEMKEAGILYFTTDRLPEEGKSEKITLEFMLDQKLMYECKDKNGDTCDVKNSYVLVEDIGDEYRMTVHLKCNDDEGEIIVYLGCYDYCENNGVCEKQETATPETPTKPKTGPSCVLEVTSGTKGSNNWYKSDVKVGFKSKKTTTTGAKIVDFGISTSATADYNDKTSLSVTKDGSTKVYGYVKDSNGKTAICTITVKRDTADPSCNLTVLSGAKNAKGNYIGTVKVGFASKTDKTSGIASYGLDINSKANYNSKSTYSLSKVGTTKVYGFVKDKAGHAKVCSTSITIDKAEVQASEPSCTLKVTSGTLGTNNWYRSNVVVGFGTAKSTNGAKIVSYGIDTKENYNGLKTYTVSKDGTHVVKGFVKDSNGNTATCSITVKRDATKPSCSLSVTSGTKASDGTYTSNIVIGFKSRTDATSGINSYGIGTTTTYAKNTSYTITTTGTHTIKGFVKDEAGNTNVCSLTVTKKPETYEYQYSKPIPETYGAWSSWTTKEYPCSNPPSFTNRDDYQAEDLGSKQISYYTYKMGKEIVATQIEQTGVVSQKTCTGWTYYKTSTTATKTYAIKVASEWKEIGIVSVSTPPTDTLSTKYEFVGMDWERCGATCTTTPYTLWKKSVREVSTVTATDTITTNDGVSVKCSSYETKDTILFSTYKVGVGYEETRTITYESVCTYKYRTRTKIKDAYIDYKWSYYNDQKLLDDGYKMTGNKRLTN